MYGTTMTRLTDPARSDGEGEQGWKVDKISWVMINK